MFERRALYSHVLIIQLFLLYVLLYGGKEKPCMDYVLYCTVVVRDCMHTTHLYAHSVQYSTVEKKENRFPFLQYSTDSRQHGNASTVLSWKRTWTEHLILSAGTT